MNVNPAVVPTFLLACGWFLAGEFSYKHWPRLSFALGIPLAIPCALAVLYYTHLFANAIWFYNLRAIPWIELTFSGIGFLGGAINRWNDAETRTGRVAVPVVFAVLVLIPFLKPILHPLDTAALQDKCVGRVCLQSSGSTCGPASAATLLRGIGMNATERDLAIESYTYPSGTEIWYLAQAIRRRGARADFVFDANAIPPSSIAGVRMGGGHFIAIEESTEDKITFVDPLTGEATETPAQLRARYRFSGMFLLVRPRTK